MSKYRPGILTSPTNYLIKYPNPKRELKYEKYLIIFNDAGCKEACHSGKLYLVRTSLKVISTSPKRKGFFMNEIDYSSSVISELHLPVGQVKTEFSSLAKSTSPGLLSLLSLHAAKAFDIVT